MKKLFQYYVLLDEFEVDPSNLKGGKVYKDSKLIIEPKYTLAFNEREVLFKVTREIPEEFAKEPDNVRISINSF